MTTILGSAHVYDVDSIDTDRIIPGKYTKTLDPRELARHVLEDLDPSFAGRVQPGDVLVVGSNFGCGSSREQAPVALKAAGVACVVARSFARIFYRNAINIGLPLVELAEAHDIANGHRVRIELALGQVTNTATGRVFRAAPMPQVMVDILREGGLVNYLKRYGDYIIAQT
ncbi:MAG: 3-isopropylmalate dehydratase small subunit [Candidatus Roseilinea sp.]|nr:MAG: 3-isopropylmalate dehydratase small subunit [Candidatus Roseilinea sp.]